MARFRGISEMAILLIFIFGISTVASRFAYPEAVEVEREEAEGNDEKSAADSVIHFPGEAKRPNESKDKVNVVPFYIIDAPERPAAEGHGCGGGQKWALGHCRDIVE